MVKKAKIRNLFGSYYSAAILCFLAVAIYVGLDYIFDLPPAGLEFESEVVRAEPKGDSITFSGEYQFLARHGKKHSYTLAFPIYERDTLSQPTRIEVSSGGVSIPFTILSQGIEFKLPVTPGNLTKVKISYTIPAPEHEAEYITRTANLWGKPLSYARFEVARGVISNYHLPNETVAEFTRFHPKENWRLKWGRAP